jgi:MarR family 2-MHQ and catechol resistance regulon transcriptional repressor
MLRISIYSVMVAMSKLDERAADLRREVAEIVHQFQLVDAAATEGPHAQLSLQELHVLEFIGDGGPRMMRELAERVLVAVNSMTSTVDRLEEKKIVRRRRSEEDRRVVHVELTAAGHAAYAAALEEKMRLLRSMLAALTEEEQEILLVLFRKIARAGRAQVQKLSTSA